MLNRPKKNQRFGVEHSSGTLFHQDFLKNPPRGAKPKAPHYSTYCETDAGLPYLCILDLNKKEMGKIFLSKTPDLMFKVYIVEGHIKGGPIQDYNEAVWKVFEVYRNKEKLKNYLRQHGKLKD